MRSSGPSPGEVIGAKYRVDRLLGRGGMGVVVAATHTELDQRVAIKLLAEDRADDKSRQRLVREARAAARLESEHVVQVYDVGELESGAPYIVMEYLKGEDLRERVRREGPLPVPEAVDYLLQACEAIAEAHGAGIVHRDLKPSNLFLARTATGGNIVKVLDFGISKVSALEQEVSDLTSNEALLGTPHYMSPEQMTAAGSVDRSADIWSLGAILHFLLTNATPFDARNLSQLLIAVLHADPTPPRQQRADIPRELEAVILRCLHKDKGRRYDSVVALAQALVPFGPANAAESAARAERLSTPRERNDSSPPPPSAHEDPTRASQRSSGGDAQPTIASGRSNGAETLDAPAAHDAPDATVDSLHVDVDVPAGVPTTRLWPLAAAAAVVLVGVASFAWIRGTDEPAPVVPASAPRAASSVSVVQPTATVAPAATSAAPLGSSAPPLVSAGALRRWPPASSSPIASATAVAPPPPPPATAPPPPPPPVQKKNPLDMELLE